MRKIALISSIVLAPLFFSPKLPASQRVTPETASRTSNKPPTQGESPGVNHAVDPVNDAVWWLPEDTQTLFVARGPFKMPPRIDAPAEMFGLVRQAKLALWSIPVGMLLTIDDGRYAKPLAGRNIKFGLEGARKFRAPAGLGDANFEGCEIVVFQQSLGALRQQLMTQMEQRAKHRQQIAGHRVAMFEQKLEDDLWKVFVAIPRPDTLICASDEGFLREVLTRMAQKGSKRALPESLPEWQEVNIAAPFFAVRHFDRDDAELDPSSPLRTEPLGGDFLDDQAVGVVFEFDPSRSEVATIKYLSGNKDALKLWTENEDGLVDSVNSSRGDDEDDEYAPALRERKPGVVEILFTLNKQGSVDIFIWTLMAQLGHFTFV